MRAYICTLIHNQGESRVAIPPTILLMGVWRKLNMNKHKYAKLKLIIVCLETHGGEDCMKE